MTPFKAGLASWLTTIGGIVAFSAVMPYFEYRGGTTANAAMMQHLIEHPDHLPYTETYRFGWAFSPLVFHRSSQDLDVKPDGGFSVRKSTSLHVGFVSWSALSLVLGVGLILLGRKVRPKPVHVS